MGQQGGGRLPGPAHEQEVVREVAVAEMAAEEDELHGEQDQGDLERRSGFREASGVLGAHSAPSGHLS